MRTRKIGMCVFSCILFASLTAFLFFMPARIRVSVNTNHLYDGVDVTSSDINVETAAVLGPWHRVTDASLSDISDKGFSVQAGMLSQSVKTDKIPVSFLAAEYVGLWYAGDEFSISESDVRVQANYYDGHVETLKDFQMDTQVDEKSQLATVTISALGESCQLSGTPVHVSGLLIEYKGKLQIGDTFDKEKMTVYVRFDDGMKRKIDDWSCDFEGVVTSESKIEVVSEKYGKDVLTPDTSNIKDYKLSYTRTVYEGDVLKPSDVKLTVIYTDDTTKEVNDLTFDEIRVFSGTKVTMKSELFGSMTCVVKPVKVTEVQADCAASMDRHVTVRKLTAVYSDGHMKEIPSSEIEMVSDLSQPLKAGTNQLKFKWLGHEYSFKVIIF